MSSPHFPRNARIGEDQVANEEMPGQPDHQAGVRQELSVRTSMDVDGINPNTTTYCTLRMHTMYVAVVLLYGEIL